MNETQRASVQEGTFFDLSDLTSNMDLHRTPLNTHRAFHLCTKLFHLPSMSITTSLSPEFQFNKCLLSTHTPCWALIAGTSLGIISYNPHQPPQARITVSICKRWLRAHGTLVGGWSGTQIPKNCYKPTNPQTLAPVASFHPPSLALPAVILDSLVYPTV